MWRATRPLEQLLAPARVRRLDVVGDQLVVDLLQRHLPVEQVLLGVPSRVRASRRASSSPSSMIDAAASNERAIMSMPPMWAMEQVVAGDRLAAQLAVEYQATGGEAAAAQDLEHAERHLLDADREAVEVPAEPVVAGVGVDRAEDAGVDRGRHLVVEVVARQRGVVDLDVDLDLVLEAVALRKP